MENVECLNYFSSMITICAREVKYRIGMVKGAVNKKTFLHEQIRLKCKEETTEGLYVGRSSCKVS